MLTEDYIEKVEKLNEQTGYENPGFLNESKYYTLTPRLGKTAMVSENLEVPVVVNFHFEESPGGSLNLINE